MKLILGSFIISAVLVSLLCIIELRDNAIELKSRVEALEKIK